MGVVAYHLATSPFLPQPPLFVSGGRCVDFFFVLSGFVIAQAYGQRLARGFSRRAFMVLRIGRIYPLHIAIVALFLAVDVAVGHSLTGSPDGSGHLMRAVLLIDGYFPDPANYFGDVSWSLSAELAAYALFAVLAGRRRAGLAVAAVTWAVAALAYTLDINVTGFSHGLQRGLIGFGIGAGSHVMWRRWPGGAGRAAGVAEIAMLAAAGVAMHVSGAAGSLLLGTDLVFAAGVLLFAGERGWISAVLRTAPFQALGRWSYSIYLLHPFVMMMIMAVAVTIYPAAPFALGPVVNAMIVIGVTVATASQTYRWVEAPGRAWARRRAARMGGGDAEAAAPTI